ncbi:MAG TPA: flippase [Candidatus Acidoferrum sp.]|nr:flippase [Candidatus Acidoferrum sp.]
MSLNLRKTSGNALSILTSDVMNRVTSFLLYAMVARHLGAQEFGQLTLALTLFYTFQVFAVGGLKTLIVRQVAKDKSKTSLYLLNGAMIVTFTSIVSIMALWGFVRVMRYPPTTTRVILLLSFGLLPYTITAVCEGLFQAWERMPYIAWVNVPVNVAKVVCAFVLLAINRGLYPVILILLFSFVAIAAAEVWIVLRKFSLQPASIDFRFCLGSMRTAATFLGIDGTLAIMSSLNIVLLSKLATEAQVGLYSAATQLLVPLLLVYQSMAQSIFPVMCRKVEPGFQSLKRIAEQAIELLFILALPAAAGLYFIGDRLISLLYKNPTFSQAFPALRIVAWVLVLQVFTSVLGQVLLASHHEKITLRIVVVDASFNLLVGWPLISLFGLRGAAMALVLTRLADCIQHYVPVSRLVSGFPLAGIVWKPLVAAACMAAYLAAPSGPPSILAAVSATLIYAAALFAVAIWASGGLRQFKDKYRPLLSE